MMVLFQASGAAQARRSFPVNVPPPSPAGYDVLMTRTREPKTRTIRLIQPPGADGVGIFCVSVGETTTIYTLREIECQIGGRGFAVARLGLGEQYHVRIETLEGSSCECMGFLRHGYCRHVLGLYALVQAGKM
jgi:hypothetical protein